MKVARDFDIREFVPKAIWDAYGLNSRWFISTWCVSFAQWLKDYLTAYYKAIYPDLKTVAIVINDWHYGGQRQYSGFRPPECEVGADKSQHRFKCAIDVKIILVFNDGRRKEVDYKGIHTLIHENERDFMDAGLTTVESYQDARSWMHLDNRWTGLNRILTVNAK